MQIYRVEDAIKEFTQEMLKEKKYCREIIKSKFNKPMRMSQDEEEMFRDEPYMWKKMSEFETIAILRENTRALHIKIAV